MAADGVERYIHPSTHLVAVVISPGYGAGWSSWAGTAEGEAIAAFDRDIVQAVLNDNLDEAKRIAKAKIPDFNPRAKRLEIEWVDHGQEFRIWEYDGYESLQLKEQDRYMRA